MLLAGSLVLMAAVILLSMAASVEKDTITITTQTITTSEKEDEEETRLLFDPPDLSQQTVSSSLLVQLNLSSKLSEYANHYTAEGYTFYMGITYEKSNMLDLLKSPHIVYEFAKSHNLSYNLFWEIKWTGESMRPIPSHVNVNDTTGNGFILVVNSIGYPRISIDVLERNPDNNISMVIHQEMYRVKAIRKYRIVDLGFTIAITIVGMLNIFAIGCLTEVPVLRSQLKKSIIPVCLASVTQYIITPLLAFGLVKAASILPEIAVGILLCSCVPGGGLGHLIVLVTGNANTELSVAINFLQILVPLGTVPIWLYSLGQLLQNGVGNVEVPTHYMVGCLALLLIPYTLGVVTKRFLPSVSDAILNWLIKPLLLLFMILFITLGLYINIYAMGVLDKKTLAMAGLIPSLGFCIGGGLTLVTKQGKASAKSVAIEAAIMNCLAVVAAAKATMPQPDSDMACAGAIAVLFFTPLPFIGMLIFHKIKKKIMNYFENRKFEKEHHETILKSFGAITQNALQMSGMTTDQINARKNEEISNNVDRTLISAEDEVETNQSVVQIKPGGDPSAIETVPLNQSNHRNYL